MRNNNDGISVIICCYNSSSKIVNTLKHLHAQVTAKVPFEIVLVDNASTDNTVETAKATWAELPLINLPFNIVSENSPGLAHARLAGIRASKFELLIFCDDDNWLVVNYIQIVYSKFIKYPDVAILGGMGIPEFEYPAAKPFWFDTLYHGYAVGAQANHESDVDNVYGAGMAIRKSALTKVTDAMPLFLTGRKKDSLSAGEDSELCLRMRLAGYRIKYIPELTFKHYLPQSRLQWRYLKKLHIGFAKTNVIVNLYQHALRSSDVKLSAFYWFKKWFYFSVIYIKYWPKQYTVYHQGEGNIEELHHLTWKYIAVEYLKLNFKIATIYRQIINLKQKSAC